MRILHTVEPWPGQGADKDRMSRARESWERLYRGGIVIPRHFNPVGTRDSRVVGSLRRLPFVHDVIEAQTLGADSSSLVMLTNADSYLVSDLVNHMPRSGLGYSHRRDWVKPIRGILDLETNQRVGQRSSGIDMVIFPVGWWIENRGKIPDLIMGCEGWDWVFKYMLGWHPRCSDVYDPVVGELVSTGERIGPRLPDLVAHELHGVPVWRETGRVYGNTRSEPANLVNRLLCLEWWTSLDDAYKDAIHTDWPILDSYMVDWKGGGKQVLMDAYAGGLKRWDGSGSLD